MLPNGRVPPRLESTSEPSRACRARERPSRVEHPTSVRIRDHDGTMDESIPRRNAFLRVRSKEVSSRLARCRTCTRRGNPWTSFSRTPDSCVARHNVPLSKSRSVPRRDVPSIKCIPREGSRKEGTRQGLVRCHDARARSVRRTSIVRNARRERVSASPRSKGTDRCFRFAFDPHPFIARKGTFLFFIVWNPRESDVTGVSRDGNARDPMRIAHFQDLDVDEDLLCTSGSMGCDLQVAEQEEEDDLSDPRHEMSEVSIQPFGIEPVRAFPWRGKIATRTGTYVVELVKASLSSRSSPFLFVCRLLPGRCSWQAREEDPLPSNAWSFASLPRTSRRETERERETPIHPRRSDHPRSLSLSVLADVLQRGWLSSSSLSTPRHSHAFHSMT